MVKYNMSIKRFTTNLGFKTALLKNLEFLVTSYYFIYYIIYTHKVCDQDNNECIERNDFI